MSWLSFLLLGWLVSLCIKSYRESRKPPFYALDARCNWLLAFAHPMAAARIANGFADTRQPRLADELSRSLRPVILHYFGLRNDLNDGQIRLALARQLKARWFRSDLDALTADDSPRDAMAFACARLTFAVRAACLLGWCDEETQWHVLEANAQRALACFNGWFDYGTAWARGRQQWLAHSRADGLGVPFGEAQVRAWLADCQHPWNQYSWIEAQ